MIHKDKKVCNGAPPGKPALWWLKKRLDGEFAHTDLAPVLAKTAAEAAAMHGLTLAQCTVDVRCQELEVPVPDVPVDRYAALRCVEEDDE